MWLKMDAHKRLSEDLEKVIMKEDGNSSIMTEPDHNIQPSKTVRERLRKLLHSHKFQISVITLVIIDCLLVITELLIDLEMHEEESLAQHVLHYCSITILSIFIVEIFLKLYAFRQEFFKHRLEVFDAIIVIVSFALDIAFRNSRDALSGVGLIIILRLWRVARVLNGVVLSVKMQAEHQLEREKQRGMALEGELSRCRQVCAAQQRELDVLRAVLQHHGLDQQLPDGNRVDVVADVEKR
uniref:Voltage-gated hydrogen channel 1 n=1 Tax=Nicoletia phytophila TaxID=1350298 RepID=A0A126Q8G2_9INSE|nr:proton channel [Nicoletia phytophila]